MAKVSGAAPWVAAAVAALLLGCTDRVEITGPPLEPVAQITRGEFAEFGRVTQVLVPGPTRQMVQLVGVRRDTARVARFVIENDDPNGFVEGVLKMDGGLRVYLIRGRGAETLYASTGTITITESTADFVAGTFGFSIGSVDPPAERYIEGWFRAERHLPDQ